MAVVRETEVIHEHDHDGGGNNGMGLILGVILLIVLFFIVFYYGLPYLRSASSPQINVPSKVDVNVHKQ